MEKKRSPRGSSSISKSPAIFPKSPLLYEDYKSGCAWKLINFFDFKHIKSGNNNKRLGSQKKKFIRDSAGNVYTKSQLDLLEKLHEKCHQCNERIAEEETSFKPKTKRRSLSSEREEHEKYESKPVQGLLEREISRIKNIKEETCNSPDKKDKQIAEINLRVNEEAAETLICSKAEEKKGKQFMEALDILSSNKELFITLLQDPNSFSAKKGQDFERSKVKESRDDKSLSMADEIVLLKPRLSSSSSVLDDRVYLRFKHLAKKLKHVVGSNKEDITPECSSGNKVRETEAAAAAARTSDVSTSSTFGHIRSPESPVFRRKKRVESDVFKLSMDNDVLPRRFITVDRSNSGSSSPVYEVPNALSSLQTKLKERREKLEKRRESFKLWSLDKNFEVFDPKPHNSSIRSLDDDCSGSAEYRSLRACVEEGYVEDRYLESSLSESNSSVVDSKQEQEQPSPVSVLERIHLEDKTISVGNRNISRLEEQIDDPKVDLFDKESIHEFAKKVLEASRLNWSNLMARCNEETSLLDEFSHGANQNNDQVLLVLDYTDEILREIYRQDIEYSAFTPLKSSRANRLREQDLIQETMRRFDWSLLCCDSSSSPRTLDQIVETDLMIKKQCLWLDSGGESDGVVSDVSEKILQQLVLEISHELRTQCRGGLYVD